MVIRTKVLSLFMIQFFAYTTHAIEIATSEDNSYLYKNDHIEISAGASTPPPSTRDLASFRIQRDWSSLEDPFVPLPQLYYQDDETSGERTLIWSYDDTLPRDVLAGRPDTWLHSTIAIIDTDPFHHCISTILPYYLDHYSRLGILPNRMLFSIILSSSVLPADQSSQATNITGVYHDVQNILQAFGADYKLTLLPAYSDKFRIDEISTHSTLFNAIRYTAYTSMIHALRYIPIKDWIIATTINEFLSFKGILDHESSKNRNTSLLPAKFWLKQNAELYGANYVMSDALIPRFVTNKLYTDLESREPLQNEQRKHGRGTTLCAYLKQYHQHRPTHAALHHLYQSTIANITKRTYMDKNLSRIENAGNKIVAFRGYLRPDMTMTHIIACDDAKSYFNDVILNPSLYDATPYSTWWQYYKGRFMVGNAFLWQTRQADTGVAEAVLIDELLRDDNDTHNNENLINDNSGSEVVSLLPLAYEASANALQSVLNLLHSRQPVD